MREAYSIKQLKSLAKEMSRDMRCGGREVVVLSNLSLLQEAPKIFMSVDLSIVNAEESKGKVILTVENRFAKRCEGRK
ncbi:MAG: hypothetical protein J7L55_01455 [Desulfurococcales archaeon]|nr:hypothetical protein [Desulfurococcales archaeon]